MPGYAWGWCVISSLFDRSDYPTLTDAIYLNQASLGLIGQPAVDAMHEFLDGIGRHGNLYMSDDDEVGFLDALRFRAARLFQSEAGRIAILSSASELLGQVPLMLPPPSGAKVMAVSSDFPAITRPWLRLAERGGCRLDFVDDNPESDLTDDLITRIDNQTFLIAVGHVQYATGTVIDIPRLQAVTAEADVRLIVDATQGAGAMETRIKSWDADIVVSSGYKWLGGHGGVAIGVISRQLLQETPPLPGWMGAPDPFEFDATRILLAEGGRRYTQSTMSYVSVAGLTAAIDQLLTVGAHKLERHAGRLGHILVDAVEPYGWHPFRHLNDPAASLHIISLRSQGDDLEEVSERLRTAGIVCSGRGGRLRVSLAPYNDESDIAAFVNALAPT
ncbi:MAG: aminotransferase class V-fold PLP-dependent enzyme [Acidobacteria bacterium]|nr:MAG: aminotransferase class V-fold PLP-dependent enzyme [Acidobacteriota bacterium]